MTDPVSDAEDMSEFRAAFFEECVEMLAGIDRNLTGAKVAVPSTEVLNDVFRAVHTIKGSAGFFHLPEIVRFAHAFEALLGAARENRIAQADVLGSLLVEGADLLATIIDRSREGSPPQGLGSDCIARIESLLSSCVEGGEARPESGANAVPAAQAGPRRMVLHLAIAGYGRDVSEAFNRALSELRSLGDVVVMKGLDSAQLEMASGAREWVGELTTAKSDEAIRAVFSFLDHSLELHPAALPDKDEAAGARLPTAGPAEALALEQDRQKTAEQRSNLNSGSSSTIRVDLARVDRLVNMVGELVITQAMLAQQLADQEGINRQQLRQGHEDLANYTRELQECVMAIRMQPVKSVFSRIPRLVREISGKLGKKVRLVTSGEQTEVDKTVVEELADPLLHMIRNAIDHGIESSEKRQASQKPEEGTIELAATQRGGNILITVSDDGAGIDRQRVLRKAIERGIVPAQASLSSEEIDQLIFAPGFSTAEAVTDVSGRGVGMDVVQSKIGNLGGRIHISSTLGQGTKFTLILPLTLAVLDGMMVSVARETYILPLTNIVETIRPQMQAVRHLANGSTVVAIRGELIRLVSLGDLFGLDGALKEPWKALCVVVELDNGSKLGILVDELIGQRQVVVKSLQENFDPVPGVSGATILGNGRVALILDLEQLAKIGTRQWNSGASREEYADQEKTSDHAFEQMSLIHETAA